MSEISKVRLLNVPLESDYKNTLYFSDKTTQQSYFAGKVKKTLEEFSYIRKDNIISVDIPYDELIGCNYVMYQNTKQTNKWYYAFITELEYRNHATTWIHIQTDVMQTWLYDEDYTVNTSFIDREHTKDDTVGSNLVEEGLELGEYVSNMHALSNYATYCKIIVGVTEIITDESEYKYDGGIYNGIYSGIKYYCFLNSSAGVDELKTFIDTYSSAGKSEAIVCMFLAPSKMLESYTVGNSVVQSSNTIKYYINTAESESDSQRVIDFDETLDGYTPTNKKLLTYPYRYLLVSNNAGGEVVYKYENWYRRIDGNTTRYKPRFLIEGALTPGCSIRLIPLYYKNTTQNDVEGLNMGKFPTLNWTSDYFTNWLTQNAVNIGISSVTGALSVAGGVGLMMTGAGAMAGGGMIASGVTQIASTLGEIRKADIIPAQAKGNLNSGDVTTGGGRNDFHFYSMSIKEQSAKIIDDYFTMYGYKTNRVKKPNMNHRERFWFIKTIGVNIDGAIPNNDLQTIKNCFDNGITFWRHTAQVDNYDVTNNII